MRGRLKNHAKLHTTTTVARDIAKYVAAYGKRVAAYVVNVTARHTLENLSVLGAIDENSKLKRREKLQSSTRSRDALKSGGSGSLSDPWLGVEPSRDSEGRSRGLILT